MSEHEQPSNVGWSVEEDNKLARMYLADEPPRTIRECSDELGKSKSATDRRITALGLRGRQGDRALYERLTGVALEPVLRPVRVDLPAAPRAKPRGVDYSVLVWSDVHFPFQSDPAIDILRQVARDLQPRKLVCLGDVFDFFELSDHRAPRDQEPDIQEALNLGVQHLADMRSISGADECDFMGGNHEDRWDRMLEKAAYDVRFRQLLQLPKIKRALQFSEIVGFKELGYEYHPYTEGHPLVENDRLVYIHGYHTGPNVTRQTLTKYGKSVVFGHKHVIQNVTKRDLKGTDASWCIGCLCTLDPFYEPFADWAHGFAVVNWCKVDGSWHFDVETVRVHNDVAVWRGNVYKANL